MTVSLCHGERSKFKFTQKEPILMSMTLIVELNAIHIVTCLSQYNLYNYRYYKKSREVLVTLSVYFVWQT
jgi:hypothetical protein